MHINSLLLERNAVCPQNGLIALSNPLSSNLSPVLPTLSPQTIGTLSEFDKLLIEAQNVQLVDSKGWVLEEIKKKHPLKALKLEEISPFIALLLQPLSQTVSVNANETIEITYNLLEYFQYQIKEADNQFEIEVMSVNIFGGKLIEMLKGYCINTLNDVYLSRCNELKSKKKAQFISQEVEDDFNRKAPDTDFLSKIKFDPLKLLTRAGTRFCAEWLPEKYGSIDAREKIIIEYRKKLESGKYLSTSSDGEVIKAVNTAALALVNKLGTRFFASKLPSTLGKFHVREAIIKKNFYHDFCTVGNFSLVSFGPENCIVDSNYVLGKTPIRGWFHHGLTLDLKLLIKVLPSSIQEIDGFLETKKHLLPKLIPQGGLQPLFERAWKRLRFIGDNIEEINDRALFALISNKTIRYSCWETDLQSQLRDKITFDPLPQLKKKLQTHHGYEPLAFIPLAFNAIMALHEGKALWSEMMQWYHEEIDSLQRQLKPIPKEGKAPFFIALKESLDNQIISITGCKAMLQICGFILHCSPQPKHPTTEIKACITNPEATWHELCIYQKIEGSNYAISMPFNLFEAIPTLLKLDILELNVLSNLVNHLLPKEPYVTSMIPSEMVTDSLADETLKCLDHPHKALNVLGYEMLLLYTLSTAKPWALKNLLKYLPKIYNATDETRHTRLLENLSESLKYFSDKKLISPIIDFCLLAKKKQSPSLFDLCLAMISTEDPDLIYVAINQEEMKVEDQVKLLKSLLPYRLTEAAKLLLKLQKANLLKANQEFDLFSLLSEVVKNYIDKNQNLMQLVCLSACADQLLRRHQDNGRRVAFMMVQTFLVQKSMEEAQKWMVFILNINSGQNDYETLFFVPQKRDYSLMSMKLPPKPLEALEALLTLQPEELLIFAKLIEQLPYNAPNEFSNWENIDAKSLSIVLKKYLMHKDSFIQRIGFELLMVYTIVFPSIGKIYESPEIDPRIKTLVSFLPVILSKSIPKLRDTLLDKMEDLLPPSCTNYLDAMRLISSQELIINEKYSAKSSNRKLNETVQNSKNPQNAFVKELYQTNCLALASIPELCDKVKSLVGMELMNKEFALNFTAQEQLEIAFTTIKKLLPGKVMIALDILQKLEKENAIFKTLDKQSIFGANKKEILISIISTLITKNHLQLAKERLIKSTKEKIFKIDEDNTTRLWLNWCEKALSLKDFGSEASVELWKSIRKQGGLTKKHFPERQVDLLILLLQQLNHSIDSSTASNINELLTHLEGFPLSREQKTKLALWITHDLQTAEIIDIEKLKHSYHVLKETDFSWANDVNINYNELIILWLKSAATYPSYQEESWKLLSNGLKYIESRQSLENCYDEILKIIPFIIKILKEPPHCSLVYREFKTQVAISHSIVADQLQNSGNLDLYLEYFHCLSRQDFFSKLLGNATNQSLWISDEVLKSYPKDGTKLQALQDILKKCIYTQVLKTQNLDFNQWAYSIKLANALIENQLFDMAKPSIDFTLKLQKEGHFKDTDLGDVLNSWLECYTEKKQIDYCLKLFNSMCSGRQGQQCLKIAKAFFQDQPNEVLKAIEPIVFSEVLNSDSKKKENKLFFDDCIDILEMVIDCNQHEIAARGVKYLILVLSQEWQGDGAKTPEVCSEVCEKAFQKISNEQQLRKLISSKNLEDLVDHQMNFIRDIPSTKSRDLEKKMWLFKLKNCSLQDFEKFKKIFFEYTLVLNKFRDDQQWTHESIVLITDMLIKLYITTNDHTSFIRCNWRIINKFENQSKEFSKIYLFSLIRNCLSLKLNDSPKRAVIKFIISPSFQALINIYVSGSETKNVFRAKFIEKKYFKEIEDLISLIELYLSTRPISNKEWAVELEIDKEAADYFNLEEIKRKLNLSENEITITSDFMFLLDSVNVTKLEAWGYEKYFPVQAVLFQLMLMPQPKIEYKNETPIEYKNETPLLDPISLQLMGGIKFEDELLNCMESQYWNEKVQLKLLKDVSYSEHLEALKKSIHVYQGYKNPICSIKALNIIEHIPKEIWESHLQDVTDLFIKVIEDELLYPNYVQKIGDATLSLANYYKTNIKSSEMSTKLCICLCNKLFDPSICKSALQSYSFGGVIALRYLFAFLSTCLKFDLFDKKNKSFVKLFECQLDLLIDMPDMVVEDHQIGVFIDNSLRQDTPMSCDNKEALFKLISKKLEKIFPCPKNNQMVNINLSNLENLDKHGYFNDRPQDILAIFKMFINHFPKLHNVEVEQNLLMNFVTTLFNMCNKCKETNHIRLMLLQIFSHVSGNMDRLIVNNDENVFNNIAIFSKLYSYGYFDRDGSHEELNKIIQMLIDQCQTCKDEHKRNFLLNKLHGLKRGNSLEDIL